METNAKPGSGPERRAPALRRAVQHLASRAQRPARGLEAVDRRASAPRPTTSCSRRGRSRLLRYRRETPATYAEPLLFCYALINRPYILDLQPDKSVVRQYLERGFDVYLIDWGVPTDADHVLDARGLRRRFLERAVDPFVARTAASDLHLLGYCMGGTLSTLLHRARSPSRSRRSRCWPRPIDFSGRRSRC